MSQSLWEPEISADQDQQATLVEVVAEPAVDASAEPAAEPVAEPVAEETAPVALTADEFSALEDRILRAVDLVKRERQMRTAADERAAKAEAQLADQGPVVIELKEEIRALRAERDHVRQRVERLLSQLDALEL